VGGGSITFTVQTKREFLPDVLDLVRQVLREPALPAEEFEILKREQIAALEKSLSDPQPLAFRTANNIINPYAKDDPRYQPTVEEQLEMVKALNVEQVRKLYDEFLGSQA